MRASKRQSDPPVIDSLLGKPYRFEFVQAVNILERWLRDNGVSDARVIANYLRFRNSTSMNFPASQIEALTPVSRSAPVNTAAELTDALLSKQLERIDITPAFMGFLGNGGALPSHFTEQIANVEHVEKNQGPRAFLDIFSTRALHLFYRAYTKYRIEYARDKDGGDGYLPLLLLLAGIIPASKGTPRASSAIFDETPAYYSAAIRQRTAAGGAIGDVLTEHFKVPVEVLPFDGCWDDIPVADQTRLGGSNAILGRGATLGVRKWRRDRRVRIRIGPLTKQEFSRFAPGADGMEALAKLLGLFPCAPLLFRVQLILLASEIKPLKLTAHGPKQLGLGLDTFLVTRPVTADRDHYQCDLKLWGTK